MAPKHCHALGCGLEVPKHHLMCLKHWEQLPPATQREVRAAFFEFERGGSLRTYLLAKLRAQLTVAVHEQKAPEVIDWLNNEIARVGRKGGN